MILSSALSSALLSAQGLHLILSWLAAMAYASLTIGGAHVQVQTSRHWLLVAWVLHGVALGLGLFGEPAHFGFATALSATFWLVVIGYYAESLRYPQLPTRWALSVFGSAVVLLAFVFPGKALPETASIWLPVHLTLGVVCYGLFCTALIHGWLMQRTEKRMRSLLQAPATGLPLLTLERLTYRFVTVGFILLTATLAVGVLFGELVYGKAWAWDHKTVFSLLSWITFAILLTGRTRFGWRGKRAMQFLYVGSVFLLLAYVGSRFVMEIILRRAG